MTTGRINQVTIFYRHFRPGLKHQQQASMTTTKNVQGRSRVDFAMNQKQKKKCLASGSLMLPGLKHQQAAKIY
jgi:hypothetical protein